MCFVMSSVFKRTLEHILQLKKASSLAFDNIAKFAITKGSARPSWNDRPNLFRGPDDRLNGHSEVSNGGGVQEGARGSWNGMEWGIHY